MGMCLVIGTSTQGNLRWMTVIGLPKLNIPYSFCRCFYYRNSNPIYKFITSVCDGARRSGRPSSTWGCGRERSIIDRLGPTFLDFDLGVGGGGGRGLLHIDPARHSRILTDRACPIYKFTTSVRDEARSKVSSN